MSNIKLIEELKQPKHAGGPSPANLRGGGARIFAIGLHNKDTAILEEIKSSLGVGKIHIHGKDSVQYRVESS
jgi:hypothetical protein